MNKLIKPLTNILRRSIIGSETEKVRNQYYKDAESIVKSRFNRLTSIILIWRIRRARKKVEAIFSVILDPAFQEAVTTYSKAIAPIVEQIVEDEMEKAEALEEASVETVPEQVADLFKKFAPSA